MESFDIWFPNVSNISNHKFYEKATLTILRVAENYQQVPFTVYTCKISNVNSSNFEYRDNVFYDDTHRCYSNLSGNLYYTSKIGALKYLYSARLKRFGGYKQRSIVMRKHYLALLKAIIEEKYEESKK